MKILVIDDEQSFGALLSHTLKRLGHKPVVAVHPEDALEMLSPDVDAVITDIDMPVMNGVQLAQRIRERDPKMPVAFCTGSSPEGNTFAEAQQIGRVLPKVWTVADVKEVVRELEQARQGAKGRRRRRRSSVSDLYRRVEPPVEVAAEPPTARQQATPTPARRRARRVRIAFKNWEQVRRLTGSAGGAPAYVTVPGPRDLDPGEEISIALALPDEITVRIAGEVQAVRPRGEAAPEIVIALTGLDGDAAARLRALADASEPAADTSYLRIAPRPAARERTARGSDPPLARGSNRDMRVSDILQTNRRLRDQIEGLAAKMTPRPETDED